MIEFTQDSLMLFNISNKNMTQILIAGILTFVLSCQLKINEPAQQDKVTQLSSASCLEKAKIQFKKFTNAEANNLEVAESFQCYSKILQTFKAQVRGQNKGQFSRQELVQFVENNFIENKETFAPEFIAELIQLKVSAIGGDESLLTEKELDQLSTLLIKLIPTMQLLNEEMPLITGKVQFNDLSNQEITAHIQKSKAQLQIIIHNFVDVLLAHSNQHSLNSVMKSLELFSQFAKSEITTQKKFYAARLLVSSLNSDLLQQNDNLTASGWKVNSVELLKAYEWALKVKYLQTKALSTEQKLDFYQTTAIQGLEIVEGWLRFAQVEVIQTESLNKVLDAASLFLALEQYQENSSQKVISSFFKLKPLLFKVPSLHPLTINEIEILENVVNSLFTELKNVQKINSELKLFEQQKQGLSREQFIYYQNLFLLSLNNITQNFNSDFQFSILNDFILNVFQLKLYDSEEHEVAYKNYYDLAVAAKLAFTGDTEPVISLSNLQTVLKLSGHLYFDYQFLTIQFFSPSNYDLINVSEFSFFKTQLMTHLTQFISFQKNNEIKPEVLVHLYAQLKLAQLIESDLTSESLEKFLITLTENLLTSSDDRLSGLRPKTITGQALNVLNLKLDEFYQGLEFLEKVKPSQSSSISLAELKSNFDLVENSLGSSSDKLSELLLWKKSLGLNLEPSRYNQKLNEFNYFTFDLTQLGFLSRNDLVLSQLSLQLSKWLIQSFALDITRIQSLEGLNLNEADSVFQYQRQGLIELDIILPDNTTFMSSRFREANLFTNQADGNELVSYVELHDLIQHLNSGLNRAATLKPQLLNQCLPAVVDFNKIKSSQLLDESCVLNVFYKSSQGFEGLIEFNNFKFAASEELNKKYYLTLLKAAGYQQATSGTLQIKLGDVSLLPHVVQYTDMIYARYDLNRDQSLIKEEALLAFPAFRSVIKQALVVIPNGSKIKEEQLPGVYMYLLKYKKPPKGLSESLKFIKFIDDPSLWVVNSSRQDLADILSFIAQALNDHSKNL